ncbi:putative type I restriction-modification system methyltransferase subunit [Paraburkholderia xenovorans LB400]|uniref:Plasmid related protein n=1 Tax=Paraburkholderia xenovorans (strain LB400) TaxID=266265 RepID=Q13ZC8_PARXL|nr:hypothetical protein [Paraburkholderia xenovorans]ABE30561.1 Conserved hypothetical protein [Paraburkholderia xenovorans LB400]AIP32259.1 putative type I restriction-modification system methyltransferase subunit [Paraburkholderia xenovorans LB400]
MNSEALPGVLLHPLFPLGRLLATPGAIDLLDRTGTNATSLLHRHQCGDFGDLCASDVRANRDAILTGARILSCYEVGTRREKVWVITESDRSASTLLLPSEY